MDEATWQFDLTLRRAIGDRRLLELTYHGRVRVVEPHDYGVLGGTRRLLAYQLRRNGEPGARGNTGWRLFDVSKMEGCVMLDTAFPGSRRLDHQDHHSWEVIYARVK
jgi:predicted DNA-binding transcriptional regulator YafY